MPAIVLTLVLVPLTLIASRRRRRTALQLLVGFAWWGLVLLTATAVAAEVWVHHLAGEDRDASSATAA